MQDLVGFSPMDADGNQLNTPHITVPHGSPPEGQCLVCLFRAINAPLRVKKQILNPNFKLFTDEYFVYSAHNPAHWTSRF